MFHRYVWGKFACFARNFSWTLVIGACRLTKSLPIFSGTFIAPLLTIFQLEIRRSSLGRQYMTPSRLGDVAYILPYLCAYVISTSNIVWRDRKRVAAFGRV